MSEGFVYFIQAGDEFGPVKIGWTGSDPRERLKQLQVGSWAKLNLLSWWEGGKDLEAAYHRILAGCRLQGEWFSASAIVLCCAGILTPENLQELWDRADAEVERRKAAEAADGKIVAEPV